MFQQTALLNRIIQLDTRMPHAMLLYGLRGVGKYDLALSIANHRLRLDAAISDHPDRMICDSQDSRSIKIDEIRGAKQFLLETPHSAGLRVLIIRDCDKLTNQAANALLKILEEPPGNSLILLTTHRQTALPATVLSRCHQIYCPVIMHSSHLSDPEFNTALALSDGVSVNADRLCQEGLMKQCLWLVHSLTDLIQAKNHFGTWLDELSKSDIYFLADCMQSLFIDLIRLKLGASVQRYKQVIDQLETIASRLDITRLFHYYGLIIEQKRFQQIRLDVIMATLISDVQSW